jgi:acyl-CoA thioesterase
VTGVGSLFDDDTAVTATTSGRYSAEITDRWSIRRGAANGGYALAIALRALRTALPYPDPLTVSATFLRPSGVGPVEVEVEQLRTGRRLAFGSARLMQDGRELVRVVASFTDLAAAEGPSVVHNAAPDLPPPPECLVLNDGFGFGEVSIGERVEFRMPALPGWRTGTRSGRGHAEFHLRFADGRAPDTLALAPLADMATPVVLELGPWASTTIELSVHIRAVPAPGWLRARVSTRHVTGGYHEEDVELWDEAGRLVAQSRQLALLT